MGDNLIAALQLGDLRFIDSELDWLKTLIKVHHLPPQVVLVYLKTYASATERHLPEHGRLISDWLAQVAADKFLFETS